MAKRILALLQLPPPVHGASIMNQHVVNILKNSTYDLESIQLRFVDSISDIGSSNLKKIFKMIIIAMEIVKYIKNMRPNLVYFTISPVNYAFYRDLLYVSIFRIYRKKILYHLHGKGIGKRKKIWWWRLLYTFVFKNQYVIHLSALLERDISGLGYRNISFVPNGIEKIFFSERLKDGNIINIIYLSNYAIAKGILILIEACKILNSKNIHFMLDIVGNAYDVTKAELQGLIDKYQLTHMVNILGPKYGAEKYLILNHSDFLVFPTFYENECFPLVLLEAMQAGIPIISTYEGAIPEIVDDGINGFLVQQNDSLALADKIELLIKDKDLREKLGRAGRKKYLENYTLMRFEKNILHTFSKVLES